MRTTSVLRACLLALLLHPGMLGAQHPPVVLPGTHERFVSSASNGVAYKLYISLPKGHESSNGRFPTIYLLDADYSFAIARNIVEHLSDRDHLTPAIVVGIAYAGPLAYRRNRTRDYTPTHSPVGGYGAEYQKVSGGGPEFLRFIADELIPFIEREYRATNERVLVGHSYGGLFTTWTALVEPQLFSGYVAVSPSLWYDDHMIFGVEERSAAGQRAAPAKLFLTVGSREINNEQNMVEDLRRLARRLEGRKDPGLRLRWSVEDGETHNSVFPGALSDGLRFVLGGR